MCIVATATLLAYTQLVTQTQLWRQTAEGFGIGEGGGGAGWSRWWQEGRLSAVIQKDNSP